MQKLFLILIIPALILSVSNGAKAFTETHNEHSTKQDSHEHDSHTMQAALAMPELVLDGTAKWQMDQHTRSVVHKMTLRVAHLDFTKLEPESAKQQGEQLKKDIQSLIAGCTMKGDAHNQLHHFLEAFIPAVESLTNRTDPSVGKQIQSMLSMYANYFE